MAVKYMTDLELIVRNLSTASASLRVMTVIHRCCLGCFDGDSCW